VTVTAEREEAVVPPSTGPAGRRLRTALLAVIGVGLLLLGGGLGFALGSDRSPASDSVDAGFARDMSTHHLQAVSMANLAPERSEDPDVRRLAFDIGETQQNQVGRMQGWLSLWGLQVSGGDRMAWMTEGEHAGHAMGAMDLSGGQMPGMASDEELAQLRTLSGEEFDVLFLQLMTRHHQGGYDMAQYALEHAEEPAVRNLARTIVESQSAEVTLMTDMLAERGAEPLPAP
jgi:uncharacterized protein (DUF305 family)